MNISGRYLKVAGHARHFTHGLHALWHARIAVTGAELPPTAVEAGHCPRQCYHMKPGGPFNSEPFINE